MSNRNLIGIAGHAQNGKDTVAKIIQYFCCPALHVFYTPQQWINEAILFGNDKDLLFQIKKFSFKLKQIASIILGLPLGNFEEQEFKSSTLPKKWDEIYLCIPDKFSNGMTFKHNTIEEAEAEGRMYYNSKIERRPLTVRQFLIDLSEGIKNVTKENIWVDSLFSSYTDQKWIISDVRLKEECDIILRNNGFIIKVDRKLFPGADNTYESSLNNSVFDYTIDNDGTIDELIEKVRNILIMEGLIDAKK